MATTNEDKTMLTIPVHEQLDEDINYVGWTENISLFARRAPESAVITKPASGASVKRNRRRSWMENGSQVLDKYVAPLSMQCKFNSLRSGAFGSTDPYIAALFAQADFSVDAAHTEAFSDAALNEYLHSLDDSVQAASEALDQYFSEGKPASPLSSVVIPGELTRFLGEKTYAIPAAIQPSLQPALDSAIPASTKTRTPTSTKMSTRTTIKAPIKNSIEPMRNDGLVAGRSMSTPMPMSSLPFAKTSKVFPESPGGDFMDDFPLYEFPGQYGHSRRSPTPKRHFVFATAYTSSRLDYMHI
jgi:hypothetical protein